MLKKYKEEGFFVSEKILKVELIDTILNNYLYLVNKHVAGRETFNHPHKGVLVDFFKGNRTTLSNVYDEIRSYPWLEKFVVDSKLLKIVNNIFIEGNISKNGGDALRSCCAFILRFRFILAR